MSEYRDAWARAEKEDPPIPLNVDIELASACNARCTFCLYGDRDWDERMREKEWDGENKRRLMKTDLALRIIDEAAAIGVPALKFNFRGESLIHSDYGMIVSYAASKNIFWELLSNTNGNIPPANWNSGILGLMACTKVAVSLDSLDPGIYPKVRIGLSLDSAIRTIDELVRLGHPDLWVRRVVCKSNQSEDFVGSVRRRWPKGLRVSEHFAVDRNHYQEQELTGEDHTTWERQFCGYTAQRAVIESSGRYSACCIAWEGELSGGTYPNMSIMEYWNSPWRRKLTDELRVNVLSSDRCKNCSSFMSFKRPERAFVSDVEGAAKI